MRARASIAYFSMEIGLEPAMPTYSGGLGVLAGDTVRSAADAGLSMVGVTLLHRKGYFHQRLDETGWQTEEPVGWEVEGYLTELPARASVTIEGRTVAVRAWSYEVRGVHGHTVPVYFLDANLETNAAPDRILTDYLYGGDDDYRLSQEVILGIGGVRILRSLGYEQIQRYHMNEGHASLLALELLHERIARAGHRGNAQDDIAAVRSQCVFTTHTPVPSGHDKFSLDAAKRILGSDNLLFTLEGDLCCEGMLNMTFLALATSHYINGVAKSHRDVSREMFAQYPIDSITNGVHVGTWVSEPIRCLFDHYVSGWREDNPSLRYALSIPREEIWQAHQEAKRELLGFVERTTGIAMDPEVLTLGYARRATAYKRPELLFRDPERLRRVTAKCGPLQIIYGGKAHPHDNRGKELIQLVHRMKTLLDDGIRIVYLQEYDMAIARLVTAGTDLWLNTPLPPREASGTSGMKSAVNGVPSFSILDGWWVEGCIEGVTGWSIGEAQRGEVPERDDETDARSLYDKLERVVMPTFYKDRDRFIDVMRHAIALNASFFNTERMLNQYVTRAYFR